MDNEQVKSAEFADEFADEVEMDGESEAVVEVAEEDEAEAEAAFDEDIMEDAEEADVDDVDDEPNQDIFDDEDDADDDDGDSDGDGDEDGDSDEDGGESGSERGYNSVSEEELDKIADTTIETLQSILGYFGAADAEVDEYEGEDGELILDIVGDNLAVLIGRHGKTLDSLQFLVSAIVSKKIGFRYPVVIDVEGYKQRRKQKVVSLAKSSAARAIRQKHEVRLRPMNPYERRLIHIALRDDRRVTTVSEGVEPNRYLVIKPV